MRVLAEPVACPVSGHWGHCGRIASSDSIRLGEIGFQDVDCFFKLFGLALFGGKKPG
ncbi:MAG: hypothetical protein ACLQNE_29110 [Thermoguttaceae bacterium]|jgi:hypothetical protein